VVYEYHPLKFTYNVVISKDPDGNPIAVTSLSQTVVDCIRHIDFAGGLEELLYASSAIPALSAEARKTKKRSTE